MSDAKLIVEPTQNSAANDRPAPRRQVLGAVAMLCAVVALLAAGWAILQLRNLQAVPERLDLDTSRLASLTRQVDVLARASARQEEQVSDLASALEESLGVLPEFDARLAKSEEALAGLSTMGGSSRSDWLKAEAVYYLQIANALALLAQDPQTAATALQFADERLLAASDPTLGPVREQLSRDIAALGALPQVDRVGISFKLSALAGQTASWTFRSSVPDRFAPQAAKTDAVVAGTAWERFVATLEAVFSRIVSIKQTDTVPVAQLGAGERALIVEIVKGELQLARLALADNDTETFRQTIGQVIGQLREYFDMQSAAVSAALQTLEALQTTELRGPLPDISSPLKMLQANGREGPAPASEPQ